MHLLLTTVSQKSHAERLARLLVEKKLAACVNILKIENSVYRWKGKTVKEKEFLLLVKTAQNYEKLEKFIRKNHPYELPEIIDLPVRHGYRKYLNWVARGR